MVHEEDETLIVPDNIDGLLQRFIELFQGILFILPDRVQQALGQHEGEFVVDEVEDVLFFLDVVVKCTRAQARGFTDVPDGSLMIALLGKDPAGRTDEAMAETIFNQIVEACNALRVTLVGGHTEITHDLTRPIVIGAMLGEVPKGNLVISKGARVGDVVMLTKEIPLEGTALIAREKETELHALGFSSAFIARAKSLLRNPGISVVKEALIAADANLATAMHDPTEGGLATGLWELAQAAHVGVVIEEEWIPFSKEGVQLCAAYGLDPMGVIASGSLLLTTPLDCAERLIDLVMKAHVPCVAIGRVVSPEDGVVIIHGSQRRALARFERDEIARLFG